MLLSRLFRRSPATQPANPEEAYLAAVARRLLLAPARRAACLAELGDHLAQRAATTPFQSRAEVESRMGSPRMVATQLNAAVAWWQSRPSGRLYAASLGMLVLLYALQTGILETIASFFPNGQDNHGTFLIGMYAVVPAASLVMPALVAMLARRWCVRPLQAAVPVCLLLILQVSDTAWAAGSCLLDAFGNHHPDPAVAGASLPSGFAWQLSVQLLKLGVLMGPCALLLCTLGKRTLARWSVPTLTLSIVLAAVGAWLQYINLDGLPSAILWVVPLGAAVGVGLIALLMRRGGLQGA